MAGNYVKRFFITVFLYQLLRIYSVDGTFDYQHVNEWSKKYPNCGGKRQSPVNIDTNMIEKEEIKDPIQFFNHDQLPKTMKLENLGQYVSLTAEWSGAKPSMKGGPLNGTYILDSIHFHWGTKDNEGSEHTIKKKGYPLEMHIVHYKEDYGSMEGAQDKADGISVIGLIFQIGHKKESSMLEPIVKTFSKVTKVNEKTSLSPFSLSLFNLNDEVVLVTYLGSLTTPPCTENVTWLLTTKSRRVSDKQMHAFRKIMLRHGDKKNFRPVQPLNNRKFQIVKGPKFSLKYKRIHNYIFEE